MHKFNYILNTQQLCDAIRLRYVCSIPGLPVSCLCEEDFIVQYTMPSKKGGILTLRHNKVRDNSYTFMSDVRRDVEFQQYNLTLNGEEQTKRKIAKTNDEVQPGICAGSFWVGDQKAFF